MARRVSSRDVENGVKSYVVLPDMHVRASREGGLDLRTWDAVLRFIDDHEWSGVVQLGDFGDWNCISSHNAKTPRLVEGERIEGEYEAINNALGEIRQAVGEGVQLWMIEGNHDWRVQHYIDMNPQLQGTLEYTKKVKFKELGCKWVPYWSKGDTVELGKLTVIHGRYTTKHHEAKHLDEYGCSLLTGHNHDVQQFSKTARGDNKTHTSQSIGTLSVYDPYWMKGRPNKWQQAFAEVIVFPDGFFNYWVTQVYKNRFFNAGKVYQG